MYKFWVWVWLLLELPLRPADSPTSGGLPVSIDPFLASMRQTVAQADPAALSLFDTFASEAKFGRQWLSENLAALPPGSAILEVGAGLMLLSAQLQREGYNVTALEPIGVGFSIFSKLQSLILEKAQSMGCAPTVLRYGIEELHQPESVDFAFSVNVMEHVHDIQAALANTLTALRPGSAYRFICPNYRFPYEPHFGIPTLFSKKLTFAVLHRAILGKTNLSDPAGTWASLNWISVDAINRALHAQPSLRVHFRKTVFADSIDRLATDKQFAARHSAWITVPLRAIAILKLHRLVVHLPSWALPQIDCSICKPTLTV